MLGSIFHAWERRLASVTKDRVVRPFEWGLDWLPLDSSSSDVPPIDSIGRWVEGVLSASDQFYAVTPASDSRLAADVLTFRSALLTPHEENNTVYGRLFRARGSTAGDRAAVLVLPQWNADPDGHVGLCRLLGRFGLTALRLTLPYHEERMPSGLRRADFIVSANIGRTLQACRQAVLDARRAVAWLHLEGYDRIGILGTSLGSCLACLTAAHEPLISAAALNHVSPFFADVVWQGLSTAHVRAGLDDHITLEDLRRLWLPISPQPFVSRLRDKQTLLVYARYDLTFPVRLSKLLIREFRRLDVPCEVAALPCGHYSTGVTPFKWVDGFVLTRFLRRHLVDAPRQHDEAGARNVGLRGTS
ncbi:MAG: hypothetical protein HYX76_00885 [Acidobacteria bacterium]|nr:hypothetical protein [Acidobacteriota bacterium]